MAVHISEKACVTSFFLHIRCGPGAAGAVAVIAGFSGRGLVPGRSGGSRRAKRPAAQGRNKICRSCSGGPHLFSVPGKSESLGKKTGMPHHTHCSAIDTVVELLSESGFGNAVTKLPDWFVRGQSKPRGGREKTPDRPPGRDCFRWSSLRSPGCRAPDPFPALSHRLWRPGLLGQF